jgi:hypothetical protein
MIVIGMSVLFGTSLFSLNRNKQLYELMQKEIRIPVTSIR